MRERSLLLLLTPRVRRHGRRRRSVLAGTRDRCKRARERLSRARASAHQRAIVATAISVARFAASAKRAVRRLCRRRSRLAARF